MKKLWKVLEETPDKLVYKWNGPVGKGKKFTVHRGEFNNWHAAQLEGADQISIPENVMHISQVAKLLGLE